MRILTTEQELPTAHENLHHYMFSLTAIQRNTAAKRLLSAANRGASLSGRYDQTSA
jgi:hypothetical protein